MNFQEFIKPELLVLVPVLYLVGVAVKKSKNCGQIYSADFRRCIRCPFCSLGILYQRIRRHTGNCRGNFSRQLFREF